MIVTEEVAQVTHSLSHFIRLGQHNYSEMVGRVPVKARTGDNEDMLLMEEVKSKLLVVCDVEFLYVKLREDIESAVILDAG